MINILKLDRICKDYRPILDSVTNFCSTYLKKRVRNDFRNEVVDRSIFQEFGKMGLLGPTLKDYGCIGVNNLAYGLIAKEIESVDSGYRSMFSVQSSLVMNPINRFGSDTQKKKYLPELASGNMIGCFGLTEPNAGSNPNEMTTRAIKDGNHYVLNGNKTWITNSPIADLLLIWARDVDDNKVKGFLVERDSQGLDTPVIDGKLALRTSVTGSIYMDSVKVPVENLLPNVTGLKGPFTCLNDARFGIAFGALGSARSCIIDTIEYTKNRTQFGGPLCSKQLIQSKLANMVIEYNLALSTCLHVANLKDSGDNSPEMISLIKRNSCVKSLEIARTCRDILGGNGISDEYDIIRHMNNLEAVNTYEGTADIHTLILGKFITGISAF